MDEMRALLEQFWICRASQKERYHQVRSRLGDMRRFLTEQLGWNVIQTGQVIRLEKIPAHAAPFMGIEAFTEPRDYCLLCALLIYLEDRSEGEQFLLSELVSMLSVILGPTMPVDWTQFVQRKSLVRVLRFAEERELLRVYDGSTDTVSASLSQEVLYENTGLSRYFAIQYLFDVKQMQSAADFEAAQNAGTEADRGHLRVRRVYRTLAAGPALYWHTADDADALYLKNQRAWVSRYMEQYLGARLDVHKNAAFAVLEEGDCFGEVHPRDAVIAEVTLQLCAEIARRAGDGRLARAADDTIALTRREFDQILAACKQANQEAWGKAFREMSFERLSDAVLAYMEGWQLLKREQSAAASGQNEAAAMDAMDMLTILPGAAKAVGVYPDSFAAAETAAESELPGAAGENRLQREMGQATEASPGRRGRSGKAQRPEREQQ